MYESPGGATAPPADAHGDRLKRFAKVSAFEKNENQFSGKIRIPIFSWNTFKNSHTNLHFMNIFSLAA